MSTAPSIAAGIRMLRFVGREPILIAGVILFALLLVLAVFGPLMIDRTMAEIGAVPARRPPSPEHWLGTDGQGRDMIAALVVGLPQSLRISLFAGIRDRAAIRHVKDSRIGGALKEVA